MIEIPKLRGHHLICLHFFNGKGYSHDFVKNLRDTLKNVNAAGVDIFRGADDICRRCPYLKNEKCIYDEHSDEEIMAMDEFALELLKETADTKIKWHDIKGRIPDIFPLWFERYCRRCSWLSACEEDSFYRDLKYGGKFA